MPMPQWKKKKFKYFLHTLPKRYRRKLTLTPSDTVEKLYN